METASGDIEFYVTDETTLVDNILFELDAASGDIDLQSRIPESVGDNFYGHSSSGEVNVTTSRWNDIVSSHYRTQDFLTSAQTLTITSITASGDVIAILS